MQAGAEALDDLDRAILVILGDDARKSVAEIARMVALSPGAVRRRISRLEKAGVIAKYTVVLDHDKVGPYIEAYLELTFTGDVDVHALLLEAVRRPEIREASTIAGDPDALIRLRVNSLDHLRDTVNELRQMGSVTGSKTLVALGRLRHLSKRSP